MLLAIAAIKGWKVHQLDVIVAYLNACEQQFEIYLRQPDGFVHNEELVCKLDKGLYGLKQSGNLWFDEAATTIIDKLGLEQSQYDPALFFDRKKELYVTLYVDDFKVYCLYNATTEWFKTEFAKVYKIKDLGVASNYLGMEIEQTDGMIKVTQKRYIKYMLDKFSMTNCKAAKTPMEERI